MRIEPRALCYNNSSIESNVFCTHTLVFIKYKTATHHEMLV